MRIVQWARDDFAGVGAKICAALLAAGHDCRLVSSARPWTNYPTDLHPQQDHDEVQRVLRDADVVILHTVPKPPPGVAWSRARRIFYVHGTHFRLRARHQLAWAQAQRATVVCSTVDLTRHGRGIVYNPTPIDHATLARTWVPPPFPPVGPLVVAHTPTSRVRKGTETLAQVCASLPRVEVKMIERVPNAECLRLKAAAHVLFDSFEIGLQVSGLEAMAIGMPVIAGGDSYVWRETERRYGYTPYMRARNAGELRAWLVRLRDEREFYEAQRQHAIRHIAAHHAYDASARYMESWLRA